MAQHNAAGGGNIERIEAACHRYEGDGRILVGRNGSSRQFSVDPSCSLHACSSFLLIGAEGWRRADHWGGNKKGSQYCRFGFVGASDEGEQKIGVKVE